jgi:hypothetical protein
MSDYENKISELPRRKVLAIAALVECSSLRDAAAKSGIGVSTLRRWLASDKDFREALKQAQSAVLDLAIARAQSVADSAVSTLETIHADTTKPANARVAAARYLDSRRIPLTEIGEIKQQIAELKKLYADAKKEGRI